MAFVSIEDAKEVRERAGILNNSIDILLADLLGKDIETQQIIKQRDDAKTNKQQSEYIKLDQKLIEALAEIEDIEKQIVAYLSKNMNFDDVKNKSKVEYMMSELQDKDIENKFLEYKLNLTKDQYRDEATKINRERDSLIVKRDAIQKELDELRRKDNPDQEAIKRKEADLERIEKEIKKLQKQLDVMDRIKDLDKSGVEDLIKENNKIINHNMKSLNLKGVDPKNYSYATDLLTQITERRKIDEAIFPINSDYEKYNFQDILSAEEFYYLSKYYEKENDNPLRFNHSGKIGLFEKLIMRDFLKGGQLKVMLQARYPNLDKKSKEFKEIYKQQRDAMWVLMKSGVTPDMLRHVYRELDTDVKVFEKNSNDRSEWLRSLRIENQEQVHGDEERAPEEPEKKPDEPIKPTPTPEPEPANPDKPEEKNDTGDFLKGLENLRLTKEQEEAIRKANPKNIGEFVIVCNELGIEFVKNNDKEVKPKEEKKSGDVPVNKALEIELEKLGLSKNVERNLLKAGMTTLYDVYKNALENGGKVKGVGAKTVEALEKIMEENGIDSPFAQTNEKKELGDKGSQQKDDVGNDGQQRNTNGISISEIQNKKVQGVLRAMGVETVEEIVHKIEKGEDIGELAIYSDAFVQLRRICNQYGIQNSVEWEQLKRQAVILRGQRKVAENNEKGVRKLKVKGTTQSEKGNDSSENQKPIISVDEDGNITKLTETYTSGGKTIEIEHDIGERE